LGVVNPCTMERGCTGSGDPCTKCVKKGIHECCTYGSGDPMYKGERCTGSGEPMYKGVKKGAKNVYFGSG